MTQNANIVQLGTVQSNVKTVHNRIGSIEAGKGVRLKSDGTVSTSKADGALLGISLGVDQSYTDKMAYVSKGARVPVLLTAGFTPVVGAVVYLSDTTGMAKASATDSTACAAVYSKLLSDGAIVEDGSSTVTAALVDFVGGL